MSLAFQIATPKVLASVDGLTVQKRVRPYPNVAPPSWLQGQKAHYLIVGAGVSESPDVRAASRDWAPELARLPLREESPNEPGTGSSSDELSSKEPRMKLVISCLLMCACFLSSAERGLVRWPWDLAGEDRPLVSRASRPWVPVPLAGESSLEETEFLGGFRYRGGLEVLC